MASKANVADLPSRGALDEMADILRRFDPAFSLADDRVDLVLPEIPSSGDLVSIWEFASPLLSSEAQPPSAAAPKRHQRAGRRTRARSQ